MKDQELSEVQRAEFEQFMATQFPYSIDRRRCKNGDGNDYMSWDMGVARTVWKHMQQKLDAVVVEKNELAAENSILSLVVEAVRELTKDSDGVVGWHKNGDIAEWDEILAELNHADTPNTDATLNAVRAEGIHFAVNRMLGAWESGFINDTPDQAYDITGGFLTALEFLPNASPAEFTGDYHGKVRSAIAESRASNSDENKLSALPVERDQYGYWTHPVYEQFCDGREHIATEEFNQWLNQQDLQCSIEYRDEEVIDPAVDGYDISSWQPEAPAGEGWFVASIHDTEDGAVCIWLRPAKEGE